MPSGILGTEMRFTEVVRASKVNNSGVVQTIQIVTEQEIIDSAKINLEDIYEKEFDCIGYRYVCFRSCRIRNDGDSG